MFSPFGWTRIALGGLAAAVSLYAVAQAQGWRPSDRQQGPAAAHTSAAQRPTSQRPTCRLPDNFALPQAEPPRAGQVRRMPIRRYTLALSWSPGHCARRGRNDGDDLQCSGAAGNFGFVLHGLWPEGEGRNWPQYCAPTRVLDRATLRQHLCMTPSPQLLQHEWAKHGSCMSRTPEAYFAQAADLYHRVRIPDMSGLTGRRDLTAGDVRAAFVAANPGLARSAVLIKATNSGWLEEVDICLDRRFRYAACPAWQNGAGDSARLRIEPQR